MLSYIILCVPRFMPGGHLSDTRSLSCISYLFVMKGYLKGVFVKLNEFAPVGAVSRSEGAL